jgi:hypothetical protein
MKYQIVLQCNRLFTSNKVEESFQINRDVFNIVHLYRNLYVLAVALPLSITRGALGPTSIATAPAPPVGRALPFAYTAISPATTIAKRPETNKGKLVSELN